MTEDCHVGRDKRTLCILLLKNHWNRQSEATDILYKTDISIEPE